MAPKRKAAEMAAPFHDDSGDFLCQPQNNYLVSIGVNLKMNFKKLVRMRNEESPEEAVRRWLASNEDKVREMREAKLLDGLPPKPAPVAEDNLLFDSVEAFNRQVEAIVRPARHTMPPERFVCISEIKSKASGARHSKKDRGPCENTECRAIAEERVRLQMSLLKVKECCDELQQIAEGAGEGDTVRMHVVLALQRSLLDVIDGAEEAEGQSDRELVEIAEVESASHQHQEHEANTIRNLQLVAWRSDDHSKNIGTLSLSCDSNELIWEANGDSSSACGSARYALQSLAAASTVKLVHLSPFSSTTRLMVDVTGSSSLSFDTHAQDLQKARTFADHLSKAVAGAKEVEVSKAIAPQRHEAPSRSSTRVLLGRELRGQLLEVMRLRNQHKSKEADVAIHELETHSSAAALRAEQSGLTRKRATHLRNEAFSYGGLKLTQDIVSHFLAMPEVRELLRNQRDFASATTNDLIVNAAKHFLAALFKPNGRAPGTGGRLNDDARNAHTAALATLLPRNLFESRQGRAACRALGISYKQAKRGTLVRGELLDSSSGWKRIKTAEHHDKVDYRAFIDEAWHSDLLSTPDNQNKQRVRVDLGKDPVSGEKLYDIHERRAQLASTKQLLTIFRQSEYAGRLREASKTPKRPHGVKVGIRQFTEARCPCIQKRKPSQCDCEQCTYIVENIYKLNKARAGWHSVYKRKNGFRCRCHIHAAILLDELAAAHAQKAWDEAGCAGGEDRPDLSFAAETALDASAKADHQARRARTYDSMFKSPAQLMDALLPCGRVQYPDYTVSYARTWSAFAKDCAEGNCPKKLWHAREACSFTALFNGGCPIDQDHNRQYEWRAWEQRARGTNRETGEVSYSTEFVPRYGTSLEFWQELLQAVPKWIYHVWRDDFIKQGLRVYEDRKSGRYLEFAQQRAREAVGTPDDDKMAKEAEKAAELYAVLQRSATIQSDYAAQLEVARSHSATCSRPEKHNLLVSIVGYKSYEQAMHVSVRKQRKQSEPVRRVSSSQQLVSRRRKQDVHAAAASGNACSKQTNSLACIGAGLTGQPLLAPGKHVYKQHVDYVFAFHDRSYKPNARSYNIVQEDIDHFLKYGTVLHGEWFIDAQRVPLNHGSHSTSLCQGLSERERRSPDFPEMLRRHSIHDGCTSQFACGTEFHQTAHWRSKTAEWSGDNGGDGQDGIIRDDIKLVEHHGKGPYDAAGNIPNNGVRASTRKGIALQPGTRELVLHLAAFYPRPLVAKEGKDGWLAADRYVYAYYNPSKFTRFAVPESKGFEGSHSHHFFVGLCSDKSKAERDGPVHARKMFCACYACILFKFDQCSMVNQVGQARVRNCPLLSTSQLHRPQICSLQDFADELCANMIVATRVAHDERRLEHGRPYWLARVLGPAFCAPARMLHAGDEIEEGWLVVEIQWFELGDAERNAYKLNTEKKLLVVNTIVRLKGIKFEQSAGANVALRSGRGHGQFHFLSEDMHYAIMASIGED